MSFGVYYDPQHPRHSWVLPVC